MLLNIDRSTRTTFFGRLVYQLHLHAEASLAERELIERHGLARFRLFMSEEALFHQERARALADEAHELTRFHLFRSFEDDLKASLEGLRLSFQSIRATWRSASAPHLTLAQVLAGHLLESIDAAELLAAEAALSDALISLDAFIRALAAFDAGEEALMTSAPEHPSEVPPPNGSNRSFAKVEDTMPPRRSSITTPGPFARLLSDPPAARRQQRMAKLVAEASSNVQRLLQLMPADASPLAGELIHMALATPVVLDSRSLDERMRVETQLTHLAAISDKDFLSWLAQIREIEALLPLRLPTTPGPRFEVAALELIPEPLTFLSRLIGRCLEWSSLGHPACFVAEDIKNNLLAVSRLSEAHARANPNRLVWPTDINQPPLEVAHHYFKGTPFLASLSRPAPFIIPERSRFEHMHMLAGSGHGKTQTLQHLIVQDLLRSPDDVPSMVILDSQGDMLDRLSHLPMFDPTREASLARRLLIVDPSDVAFAPALNLFDIRSERLADYSQRDREQVLAGIIEIYDYVFSGLLGAELTQKQSMVFRFLVQLMLAIPGATIHTLRDLLIDASPFMPYVAKLPDTARGFFETQFFSKGYAPTREQVLRRLYGVLQNPSFERMFATPHNRLDLFDTLNSGGIVLVNTAKDFMKSEASGMFGRFIIALTLKAAMERAILREDQRRPTFLWIDEASEYFDDKIDDLLIQARKYKLGLVMAHQYLGQLPRGLPASIMTNTSIKLAGGLSDQDARAMAREMRTTPEFINALRKGQSDTSFAAYVRNVTPQALKLSIPFGTAENMGRMPDSHFDILRNASRQRLSVPAAPAQAQPPTPEVAPVPAATIPRPDDDEFWEPY